MKCFREYGPWGRIFSHVQPFYKQAVNDQDP